MARSRIGRPPLFKDRTFLMVYLERRDLRAIHNTAAAAGMPTAEWARRLLTAAAQEGTRMTKKPTETRPRRRKGGR